MGCFHELFHQHLKHSEPSHGPPRLSHGSADLILLGAGTRKGALELQPMVLEDEHLHKNPKNRAVL